MESNLYKTELINNITYLRSFLYDKLFGNIIDSIILKIPSDELSLYFENLIEDPNLDKSLDEIDDIRPGNLEGLVELFNTTVMKPFEDFIIEHGSLLDIYRFARDIKCADIKRLEDTICNSNIYNKHVYAYLFAFLEGADIQKLGQVVIDSNDIECNYLFARNIPGANVEAHEAVLLNQKNRVSMDADQFSYLFAKNIEGADIASHDQLLLENEGKYENDYYRYLFERDVMGDKPEKVRKV